MRIHDTDECLNLVRRLMDATGESTKSKAIDRAMRHYLHDLQNKRRIVNELPTEHVKPLSTTDMRLERTSVVTTERE